MILGSLIAFFLQKNVLAGRMNLTLIFFQEKMAQAISKLDSLGILSPKKACIDSKFEPL